MAAFVLLESSCTRFIQSTTYSYKIVQGTMPNSHKAVHDHGFGFQHGLGTGHGGADLKEVRCLKPPMG